MAKKKNQNSIPIKFQEPTSSLGGKGPRVPTPINQPHWKYKFSGNAESKPGYSEWAVIGTILLFAFAFGVLFISQSMRKSPIWIVAAILGIIVIFQIRSAARKTANHEQEIEGNETHKPDERERKKKRKPKHRKNYK